MVHGEEEEDDEGKKSNVSTHERGIETLY